MATFRPVKVFAEMKTQPRSKSPIKMVQEENRLTEFISQNKKMHDRIIQVTAIGEVSQAPDQCRFTVKVNSKKDNAQDAKNSVARRTDYILQTLKNHGVKEQDIHVHKHLSRCDSLYVMGAEIGVQIGDVKKTENISNLLVEKLDESVTVSLPEFFHTRNSLESLRKQASLVAMYNAKQKAREMARFVHLSIGKAVFIEEEDSSTVDSLCDSNSECSSASTVQQRITSATLTLQCTVSVGFELVPKVKKANPY